MIDIKTYNVNEISDMLKTNPETVRRWIRSGKLSYTMTSKKSGIMVSEESLSKFVKDTPKYAAALAGSMASSPVALSLIVGGLIGGLVGSIISSDKKKIKKEDVQKTLQQQISDCKIRISKNQKNISELQAKIDEDEKALQQLSYALENLDLELIATQINNESKK